MLRALLAAERCALARPSTALVKAPAKRTLATAAAGAKQRPLSPHLTIYTFRVNMITSVLFRGTGMVMTGGAYWQGTRVGVVHDLNARSCFLLSPTCRLGGGVHL